MSSRYQRPQWVERINVMSDASGGALAVIPIGADEIIALARSSTGIDSFVDLGDGDWETRFRSLVAGINDSDLTVIGRLMTRQELLRCVRTRLMLGRALEHDPAIVDEVIDRPLVVTGPARSGTTILFELLGLDGSLRAPRAADVIHPVADDVSDAQRLAMTACEQEFWADVQPEFAAIHELRSDLPVECITISAPSFAGSHWAMVMLEPGGWVPDPDLDLRFHKLVLQTLQRGQEPKRWLIKTPAYLMMLDSLFQAYPDAQVIQTHRDPAKTMPSTVSTTAMVQWLRTDNVDLDLLSVLIGAFFSAALNEITSRRGAGEFADVVGDVRFHDLMSNPVGAIEAAYRQIGMEMTDDHKRSIEAYLRDKPRGKHGVHEYRAEDWGFDPATVRSELADYIAAFGVELE